MHGLMQYLFSCDRDISHSIIMSSGFILVVCCMTVSFESVVFMYILFFHSSVEGHLCYLLSNASSITMNVSVQILIQASAFCLYSVRLQNHMVAVFKC